ncbi:hypothetical protein FRC17_008230, partial [Serendipita sp. 399]
MLRDITVTPLRPTPTTTAAPPEPSTEQPPPPILPSQPAPPPTSSGWFSRSKASTPVPPTVIPPPAETLLPQLVQEPDPIPLVPKSVIEPPVSASPSRTSWFGLSRAQQNSAPLTQPSSVINSALHTPSSTNVDLPAESNLEESVIDEAMMATVTPMSFAQAQAQSHAQSSRAAVPTGWFRRGAKRDSMTPSVDSSVPSLPPSPKRAIGQQFTTLVPVTNSSVYNSSPSSARYTLSFSMLNRPGNNDSVMNANKAPEAGNNSSSAVAPANSEPLLIVTTAESEPNSSAVTSSAASVASNQPSVAASWWPWSSVPNTAVDPPAIPEASMAIVPTGVHSSASSIAPSSVGEGGGRVITSQLEGGSRSMEVVNSASWFGFWPWNGQTTIPLPEKTEAELIKEEAMARDAQLASSPSAVPDVPSSQHDPERNPVSPDTVINRSSWAYFFSLRSAHGARQVTISGEEEEVMDLDGDPEAPAAADPTMLSMKGKSSAARSGSASPVPKPRASSTGPAVGKRAPNPPLTDSESIRKKVATSGK